MADENLVTKVASLDARLGGLEKNVQGIGDSISTLSNKLDKRSETPWGQIWAACGVVLTIVSLVGSMALNPIKEGDIRRDLMISDMQKSFMARDDIKELVGSAAARIQVNSDAIGKIQADVVPRSEHEDHWREIDRRLNQLDDHLRADEQRLWSSK